MSCRLTVDGKKFASSFYFLFFANHFRTSYASPPTPRFNVEAMQGPASQWKKVCQLHLMPAALTTLKLGGTGGTDTHRVVQSGSARAYSDIKSLANFFPSTVVIGKVIKLPSISH